MLTGKTIDLPINYQSKQCPEIDPRLLYAYKIIVGDLHANALTLFIIFIQSGILTIHEAVKHDKDGIFESIADIIIRSSESPLAFEDYQSVSIALKHCFVVNRSANRPILCLLGDITADRMTNDALILLLIFTVLSADYPLTILYSNHQHEGFLFYATPYGKETIYTLGSSEEEKRLFMGSHFRFIQFLCQRNLPQSVRKEIFLHLQTYASAIKMFDYDVILGGKKISAFFIYSHASYDFSLSHRCMERLCGQPLPIPTNVAELSRLIDKSNACLQVMLRNVASYWANPNQQESVHLRFVQRFLNTFYFQSPCWEVLWRRLSLDLFPLNLPSFEMNLFNLHGHDPHSRESDSSFDNNIGKSVEQMKENITYSLPAGIIYDTEVEIEF